MVVTPKTAVTIIREKMSKWKKISGGCSSGVASELESYNEKTDCPVPKVSCVCKDIPKPPIVDGEDSGVRMRCTNDKCPLVKFLLHDACFEQLEQNLLKILSSRGSARGWTASQLRCNLWERKGLTLIKNEIPCRCGKGLMSRDVEFYKKHELELAKKCPQSQVDNRQRKKKKNKLPLLNFNSNVPVAAELLQNGFSAGINRRMSYGQSSHSSSALFYGQAFLSESESDFAYDMRRTSTPAPCKSKLIVEKPKPLSDDRPSSKARIPGLQPTLSSSKQRKSQTKLLKESAPPPKNVLVAREKRVNQKKDEEAPTKKVVDSSGQEVVHKHEEEVVKADLPSEGGDQGGRQYTLFGKPGFFLGELLMADAKLPRLLIPHRYKNASCGQSNVEGVEVLLIKVLQNCNYPSPYNYLK